MHISLMNIDKHTEKKSVAHWTQDSLGGYF